MITKIIKRDGRKVPFNVEKIAKAIYKSASAVGGHDYETAMELAGKVCEYLEQNLDTKTPTVEQVQDAVEKVLIEEGHAQTAKSYILYRAERTQQREMSSEIMKTYEQLTFSDAKDSDIKRENANVNADTAMGTMLKYGSEGAKKFYQMFVLDPKHAEAHKNGDIHIHDLDFLTLTTTCTQIDLIKLFDGGFSTGEGHLREPQSIGSYAALAAIAIQSNQNDQHGGQSIPAFDYYMAPGVLKTFKKQFKQQIYDLLDYSDLLSFINIDRIVREIDKLNSIEFDIEIFEPIYKESKSIKRMFEKSYEKAIQKTNRTTYQAMEAFVHNLNTMHSRAGAQVPFSSINLGTDTSAEGRMVIKNFLLSTDAGLGKGETPIFPVSIFKVKEGVNYNPEDKNYDLFKLACKVSAKRLFPNFSFLDAPFNLAFYQEGNYKTEVGYMGCRTRLMSDVTDLNNQTTGGRGNLSFTSINLPRIAIRNGICLKEREKADMDNFYKELADMMDLVRDQLLERFEVQCSKHSYNFPFLLEQGVWADGDKLKPNDRLRKLLKHGSLTIGFIGLAESLKALIGKHHAESEEAQKLGLEIIGFMRKRCDEYSKQYNLNFTLIATPAEGLSGRFVGIDKAIFGKIKGVTDRDYYTNSFHVPVYYQTSIKHKLEIEAPYHNLTNGGHISYIELDGDTTTNVEAFESVIRMMKETGIGYGAINHPVDRDPVCGYVGVIGDVCPGCGRKEFDSVPIERINEYKCNC